MDLTAFDLKGKVALVTGGAHGIGFSIAEGMAKCGATVCFNCSNEGSLEKGLAAYKAAGIDAHGYVADVTDEAAVNAMIAQIKADVGPVDILVNNAGIQNRKKVAELSLEEWDRMIAVNESGVFYMCKAVLPFMTKAMQGSIINITSTASKTPHPNAAICYGASKAAVTYLTKHLAMELGPLGIRVNAVQCGPIRSDMTDQWTDEYRAAVMKKIPLGRLGTPEDVAAGVVFLASDEASWITGCSLNCSGGKYTE